LDNAEASGEGFLLREIHVKPTPIRGMLLCLKLGVGSAAEEAQPKQYTARYAILGCQFRTGQSPA
jgi:hypothetical protein